MSDSFTTSRFVTAGTVVALTAGIFVLDLLTPLEWADWLLYFGLLFVAFIVFSPDGLVGIAFADAAYPARAAFGVYGAQPRNYIFFREDY